MLAEVVKINLFDYDETSIAKCLPYPSIDKLNHTQSCELLEVQTLCHQLGSQNAIQLQVVGIQVTSPAQHSSDELRRTSMLWLRPQACQCCQNLIGTLLL